MISTPDIRGITRSVESVCTAMQETRICHDLQPRLLRDFLLEYGDVGFRVWQCATPYWTRCSERRRAPNGQQYTMGEFLDHYGVSINVRKAWFEAEVVEVEIPQYGLHIEKRQAYDGQFYTWKTFVHQYGRSVGSMFFLDAPQLIQGLDESRTSTGDHSPVQYAPRVSKWDLFLSYLDCQRQKLHKQSFDVRKGMDVIGVFEIAVEYSTYLPLLVADITQESVDSLPLQMCFTDVEFMTAEKGAYTDLVEFFVYYTNGDVLRWHPGDAQRGLSSHMHRMLLGSPCYDMIEASQRGLGQGLHKEFSYQRSTLAERYLQLYMGKILAMGE